MSPRALARRLRTTRSVTPSAPTALLALVLAVVVLPAASGASSAQTGVQPVQAGPVPSLFAPLPDLRLDAAATVRPTEFTGYRLDQDELRTALAGSSRTGGATRVSVPDPTGEPVPFEVREQSVMEPGLQAAHPEIHTYVGRSLDGTGRSVAMTTTPLGFTASVRVPGAGASWYVDPASRGEGDTYLSYYGAAVPADPTGLVERGPVDTARAIAAAPSGAGRAARVAAGQPVTVRTYRMAFVTDPTYAAYFGTANVLAAKTVLLARTNQIYNDDLAIRFLLVNGTDQLNLDTVAKASRPNGPCGANACYPATVYQPDPATPGDAPDGCSSDVLTRNEFVLGQVIGADNYDIGHIGLGVNGGGIAGLGVVGGGSKASGCTGLPTPTGDFYAVDYFSHEVGHQMGGNHTFDGDQVNCSATNRNGSIPLINPSTAVEPGSGSTVMGYAGICGQDNLQPHSDPYFSQESIDEIDAVTTAAPGTVTETQTVSLAGFDAGDSFQLTYPGAQPVTLTNTATGYGKLAVANAVLSLTGCAVNDFDYDGGVGTMPSTKGFTVEFAYPSTGAVDTCTNPQRLGVAGLTGGVTGFVGVQDQGGPGANQGATSASGNSAPTVTAPAARTIPLRTPFVLTGSAADTDGDPLTSLWEQDDPGPVQGTSLVSNTKTAGALFRVFGTYADVSDSGTLTTPAPGINQATGSPSRSFPDLAQVLSGNTNAESGVCPTAPARPTTATGRSNVPRATVECFSEFLPTADYGNAVTGRSLHFRLTARDDAPEGGGTQFADVTLALDQTAGPFLVTSRRTAGSPAPRGGAETVTWDVNGTDKATLAPQVEILLSTDGGLTFPTTLAAATANDGSESVTLPQVDTAQARIMVAAVGNYFYDVNDAPFTIGTPTVTPTTATTPGAAPGSSARATKTRIRLPRRTVTTGRRAVVRSAVVSDVASARTAGRVVVRVDGRKTRVRDVVVGERRSASRNLRLRRDLAPGRHRVVVVFKPTAGSGYLASRSRTVRLTVVGRA